MTTQNTNTTKTRKGRPTGRGKDAIHLRTIRLGRTVIDVDSKLVKDFMAKIEIGTENECWNWKAGTNHKGYGHFFIPKRLTNRSEVKGASVLSRSHRLMYGLSNGDIEEGLVIQHDCDNPSCCNPHHLTLGTYQTNAVDMVRKKRQNKQKLSEKDVRDIWKRLKGGEGHDSIAAAYGVTADNIRCIANQKSWRWLTQRLDAEGNWVEGFTNEGASR